MSHALRLLWHYGPAVMFLAAVWAAALWLFRLQREGRWSAGELEVPEGARERLWMLLLVSFASLFFELLVVRWISVEVRVFAYFKNLALIACFLGFGLGVYMARRRVQMLYVPVVLALLALVLRLPWPRKDELLSGLPRFIGGFDDFLMWGIDTHTAPWLGMRGAELAMGVFLITMLFSLAALVFVPMGQIIGHILNTETSANRAYSLNVAASLAGIWAFTGVSALSWPPELWFGVGLVALLPLWRRHPGPLVTVLALSAVIVSVVHYRDPDAIVVWSPYQKLRMQVGRVIDGRPVRWNLEVNNSWYQHMSDYSHALFERHPDLLEGQIERMIDYNLPFQFRPHPRRVLIVGAGTGNDAAGAVRNTNDDATITAVEIDPVIYELGRTVHPERPYESPRVRVIINDARNYFQTTRDTFDLVIFGFLDAHTLGSAYTNVRLDNYVYTRESLAKAASLLSPGGVMVVKFSGGLEFIGERLAASLRDVFGREPLSLSFPFIYQWFSGSTILVAERDGAATAAVAADPELRALVAAHAYRFDAGGTVPTTDDWPYLYHRSRTVPRIYILLSLVLFGLTLVFLRRQAAVPTRIDWHFFFLGLAFLLLEVQVISRMALFFGTTWQVNSLVITAVLVMILLANLVAARWPGTRRLAYPALLASLLVTYVVPAEQLFFGTRWLAGLVLAALFTLPIFFAGLIFISSFERSVAREVAFGSNLVGAVAGGLLECASFVVGVRALLLISLAAYLVSWVALRRPGGGLAPGARLRSFFAFAS